MNKKQKLLARQQSLLDTAKRENRNLTDDEQSEFDDITRQLNEMKSADDTPPAQNQNANPEPAARQLTQDEANQIREEERARVGEITAMCRDLGVDDTQMQRYISNGDSLDAVRSAIISDMRNNGAPISQSGSRGASVTVTEDEVDKYRRAASDGLLLQAGFQPKKVVDGARDFANMSIKTLAREVLAKETGQKDLYRMSDDEVFSLAMRRSFEPTSSFPAILDMTIEKSLVEGHRTANVTFDQFTKKGSLRDFKKHDNNYLAGPTTEFKKVPENGELTADKISTAKRPQRQLETYGKQFTFTREAFINDDIGLFTKVPAKQVKAARKTINKQVYNIMMGNPKIYDGKNLFCKDHGNLVTKGTGITAESLKAMIYALATQKDEFDEPMSISPAIIVVPVGMQFDMYTLFFSPTINTEGNTQAVNPLYAYREKIKIVEEPLINTLSGGSGNVMPWWLLGHSDDTDFIEVDYLNGNEMPTFRRSEPIGTLGFVWDTWLDWGVNVMDYRGAVKNPGAVLDYAL
jgi:hypothetical protein